MSDNKYDTFQLLEGIKQLFTSYEEWDQHDFEDYNDGSLAISGTYVLNRDLDGKVYRQEFRLGIIFAELIPHIYLLDEAEDIKRSGFDHFYEGGRCCLGTDVAVLLSWGTEYNALTFFENVVDPFLINTISYREQGIAVMGELKHGSKGMEEYYSSLFDVSETEIKQTIQRVFKILFDRYIPDDQTCICKKNKFLDCGCSGKFFLKMAINNQSLTKGFYNDMSAIPWTKGKKFRKR